jgi:hypothetical protein
MDPEREGRPEPGVQEALGASAGGPGPGGGVGRRPSRGGDVTLVIFGLWMFFLGSSLASCSQSCSHAFSKYGVIAG